MPKGHGDVCAGLGVFLAKLLQLAEERGVQFNATGIEADPMAVEHLRSINLFDVQQELFQAQSGFNDVNLLTFNKVVEHIPDPVPVLQAAAQAISPANGILYVEVPDVATIGNRAANDNILGALHHHLYTPQGLIKLFERVGLISLSVARIVEPSGKLSVYGFAAHRALHDRLAQSPNG
ncbi:MAG: class I SAM-dependent methyltransferase [Pseudomonadota bacterium]